jgi:hypothetical protein
MTKVETPSPSLTSLVHPKIFKRKEKARKEKAKKKGLFCVAFLYYLNEYN